MKGVSTVIATLLMLIITIALAGLAYSYISGVIGGKTNVVLSVSEQTACSTAGIITVYLKNDGTSPIGEDKISISGQTPSGTAIPSALCIGTGVAASNIINAGNVSAQCVGTLAGGSGINQIVVTGGGSTARGSVVCP